MDPISVTVKRVGGATHSQNDAERLGIELNEANKYTNSFDGKMIHIEDATAYVVKDSNRSLIKAKLHEITIKAAGVFV